MLKFFKIYKKKSIFTLLLLLFFGLVFSLTGKPSYNNNLKVYYSITPEANFYFSRDRISQFELLNKDLILGIRKIQNSFSMYGLPKKQSFWLFGKHSDLSKILEKKCGIPKSQIKQNFQNGIFRSTCGIFILYPEGADLEEVLRIVFQEYSFQLVHLLMKNYELKHIGWFQTGLPVYVAWMVTGEIQGKSVVETHAELLKYYSLYFNPKYATPLDNLENRKQWNKAFQISPRQIFGQSVISYMYWTTKTRHNAGITLLSRINKTSEFQGEFERLSGIRLHEFEIELQKKVFPEIKRWRSKNKIRNHSKKKWPMAYRK